MAKSGDRGGGAGTADRNGVRGTFDAPFGKAASSTHGVGGGLYDANKAPFDKPHDAAGGIQEKFFDGMSTQMAQRTATPNPSSAFTAPSAQGPTRPGTK